jgi:nucleoside-diphosphate-sugar epimerase
VGERFDAVIDYYAMNPGHVQDIVSAFLQSGKALQAYIFISTNMVYPGGPGNMDISALRPIVPEERADIANAASAPEDYGGLKLKCEAMLQEAWKEHGFPFTAIRPPSVIGPTCDNRHEALQRVAMGLDAGEQRTRPPAANPEGGFRLAFSEDVADLCIKVLAAPADAVRGEAFNIAMEDAVSLEEYVAACRDAAPAEVAAEWPAKEVAAAALAALGPDYRSYEGQSCLDISKAQRVLGWAPSTFAEAIKATVEWHRPLLQSTL